MVQILFFLSFKVSITPFTKNAASEGLTQIVTLIQAIEAFFHPFRMGQICDLINISTNVYIHQYINIHT